MVTTVRYDSAAVANSSNAGYHSLFSHGEDLFGMREPFEMRIQPINQVLE